ncbi:hypothetical protein R1X32_08685 (plasmid) [Rhodococcus opacus]|uniref:hypothetical protein n=1 Tax=Rhodococcus opacus TaxID=37919 RepID=UPI00146D775A|nr:hypothetical protein [Rhodococcus opacus]WKN59951.1 hypothetical protein HJ581_0039600 [Rhodococcus opacus]
MEQTAIWAPNRLPPSILALLGDWSAAAETFTSAAHRMATAHVGTGDSPNTPVGAS